MRPIERVDNFLNVVDWNKLEERWKQSNNLKCVMTNGANTYIIDYWKENPDQRIGQVLINIGLLADRKLVRNDEEFDILLDQGIAPEDCLYWTSIYDKDDNLLDKPVSKLLKDLTTEHIVNIYKYIYVKNKRTLSESYNTAFENILVKRKEREALTVIQGILDTLNTINIK